MLEKDKSAMKIRTFIILCLLQYLLPQLTLAQAYPFRNYTIEDGLVQSSVSAMLQDSYGYVWLGTETGMSKFDGINFTNYTEDTGFSDNAVYTIFEDSNNDLWFGSNGDGVFYFNDGQFTNFTIQDGLASNRVFEITEDSKGTVWIGTYEGVSAYKNSEFINYTTEDGLAQNWVREILEDNQGNLWIGTDNGVSLYKNGKFKSYDETDGLSNNRVFSLVEDRKGDLWIGTFRGLSRFKDGSFTNYLHEQGIIHDIRIDSKGRFLFATSDGVHVFANNRFRNFTSKGVLSGVEVQSILEDREGNLWFGTSFGVSVLSSEKFLNFTAEHGLIDNQVWAISEDRSGAMWFATNGGLSVMNNGEFISYTNESGLIGDVALALLHDREGDTWIGTSNGLSRLHDGTFFNYTPEDSLGGRVVVSIIEDKEGTPWFATYSGGASYYKNGEFFNYSAENGLYNSIESIFEDSQGVLWFGTKGGGFYSFRDSKFDSYTEDHGLIGNHVLSIAEDQKGQLWIGTTKGLSRFSEGEFTNFTSENGLSDNRCSFVIVDDDGFIWIGTKKGLNKFDGERFKVYTKSDGLPSSEMNDGAVFKDSRGNLWFGTVGGAAKYNKEFDLLDTIPPPVYLTNFRIFDRDTTLAYGTKLNHDQNYISFDYVGICFTSPQDVQYSYKLEGLDKEWKTTDLRTVQYAFLPPHDYTFKVKAMNNDGVWSDRTAEIGFVINPPFWQTWWFRFLLILFVLLLAYTWHRKRLQRFEGKKKELESRVMERTKAAEDLQNALDEVEKLKNQLHAENIYLQDEIKIVHNFENIITKSDVLKKVLNRVEQVAATDATVLVLGESGTGKELVARAIHKISDRGDRPLVKVNCSALPANLIESELFGHEKGAFTGAIAKKIGRFELANGGTILLDEIGDLPRELQAKLLRVLQEGEFERLGNPNTIKVDVRVIAATNRDLEKEMVRSGFRKDLYFRLNVFPILIPPLRDRKEDIVLLVNHFVKKYSAKLGKKIDTIPQNVLDALQSYKWLGNVRELENIIERAVIITPGKKLVLGELPQTELPSKFSHFMTLEENEKHHIIQALEKTGWRVSGEKGAAKILGINSQTLVSRMKKLGIEKKK